MGLCFSCFFSPSSTSFRNHVSNNHSSSTGTEFSSATATTTTSSSGAGGRSQISEGESSVSGVGTSDSGQILETPNLRIYSFSDLRTATRNFGPEMVLGQGGFGKVYKGWVDEITLSPSKVGSGMAVAVKRLNSQSLQGLAEWRSEINFLGKLSHPNLVKLLGYCWEDKELLLVYELMPKGSLDNHLFRRNAGVEPLSWDTRLKIAVGAARGLAFLHGSNRQVIYRDFKASNILLDSDYNAKISDFGLAKRGPSPEKSHVTTRIMGTYGYAAPEYMATGHLYVKSDVYAFGAVLLEMMTGLRAHDTRRGDGKQSLVEWLRPSLSSRSKLLRVMDTRIKGQYSSDSATELARITLSCLELDPKKRPHMSQVLRVLENARRINVPKRTAPNASPRSAAAPPQTHGHRYRYQAAAAGGHRRSPARRDFSLPPSA
ncbi:PREDICTED: probable serine/threonine-protein kinase Cx32, chloroplastic isoform X2 [Tarenaya hassleriana]|uniref:probable serine/threonine-protein kinase Cx32, chloroplastic isoform X2 n=1 Tax=Tarenaya hassleriana TaxID=28532 RepID=UPI00053C968D|nr:PREDICTED: probable serine/threonine-protein kinase Cx32, chloroplastic isoform X2 [Tarenaya hassleriana]